MEKVYVVLLWFYEGDSNLVDSFWGVYKTKEEAVNDCKEGVSFVTEFNKNGEPVDWGQYGSESKFEIREILL